MVFEVFNRNDSDADQDSGCILKPKTKAMPRDKTPIAMEDATKMDNMANMGNTANEDDPNWNEWGSWNKSANMNPTEDEDQTDPNWNEWGGSWRICNWCSSYTYKGMGVP